MMFINRLVDRAKYRKEKMRRAIEYKRLKRVRSHLFPQYHLCKNCGTELKGMYCYGCGQYALDINQGFLKYIRQFFENTYQLDGRVLQTLKYLFARPGFLTKEFVKGRVNSYVHPMKLYMFVSVVFFSFALTLFSGKQYVDKLNKLSMPDSTDVKVLSNTSNKLYDKDSLNNLIKKSVESGDKTAGANDKTLAFLLQEVNTTDSVNGIKIHKDKAAIQEVDSVSNKTDKKGKKNTESKKDRERNNTMLYRAVFSELTKYLPFVVMFLVPVYAWIMRGAYKKTRPNYMHNFVFAMHYHTVFMIFSTVTALSIHYFGFYHIITILGLVLVVYNVIAVKDFYQKGWINSIIKSLLTLFWYSFILLLVLSIAVLVILIMVAERDGFYKSSYNQIF